MIEINGLNKIYGTGASSVHAIKNVELSIEQGEFLLITGESGSGKSTLMNIIGGIDEPSSGEILYNNSDLGLFDDDEMSVYRNQNVGFVFQSFNLVPILSVEENILLPIYISKSKVDNEYIDGIIERLGIVELKMKFCNELSGGQQQRVAIARALANKPDIILADEPTGNLDSKTGMEVLDLLTNTVKELGQTLIMITHNLAYKQFADRVVEFRDGELINIEGQFNEYYESSYQRDSEI